MKKLTLIISILASVIFLSNLCFAQSQEVVKGGIPEEFLEKNLKTLPSGISIWDETETMSSLKGEEANVLLVDTRPRSFYKNGTFKRAVLLVYNKDEELSDASRSETAVLTKESLGSSMSEAGADKVMFFCQGPKCHRSYNAALHSVSVWGLSADDVIWGRAGYPNLLKYVQSNPKSARKMNKYFKGAVLSQ